MFCSLFSSSEYAQFWVFSGMCVCLTTSRCHSVGFCIALCVVLALNSPPIPSKACIWAAKYKHSPFFWEPCWNYHRSFSLRTKYCFYYVYWTNDSFATKWSVTIDHLKPKCSVTILDCCVEGQGHSECSKVQFVQTVISELLNLFVTGLARLLLNSQTML